MLNYNIEKGSNGPNITCLQIAIITRKRVYTCSNIILNAIGIGTV